MIDKTIFITVLVGLGLVNPLIFIGGLHLMQDSGINARQVGFVIGFSLFIILAITGCLIIDASYIKPRNKDD